MTQPESKRKLANLALTVALVAALFALLICVLLTLNHLQLKQADPLNNKVLAEMRDRYAAGDQSEQIKTDIQQLDLLARKAYFVSVRQITAGGTIATLCGVVMLIAFGFYKWASKDLPPPSEDDCEGVFWIAMERSRLWVAGGTVLLVAVSIVLASSARTTLTPELAQPPPDPATPGDNGFPTNGNGTVEDDANTPIFPEGYLVNSPAFRGPNGNGLTDFADVPTSWSEKEKKNLLWKVTLDLPGWAAPVVWEDRVIVLGADLDQRKIYCLNANTGKTLWTTKTPFNERALDDYKPDTMDDRWDELVFAGATPATNGKQVFAQFSNGQLLALDLASGDVLWDIVPGNTTGNSVGWDNSLLIYKNSVIVVFQGKEKFIARYDARTGKQIWRTQRKFPTWSSPILAKRPDGKVTIVLLQDPEATAWDPETGKELWSTGLLTNEDRSEEYVVGPSAVQVGDRVFFNFKYCGMYGLELVDGKLAWKLEELPDESGFHDGASMTTDGKYLYQFHNSVITCVDPATGAVVKQKEFDDRESYASPIVNQGILYLFTEVSKTLVVKADPKTNFEKVGTGSIEELFDAPPAVVQGRIYLKSDKSIYCLGTKKTTK